MIRFVLRAAAAFAIAASLVVVAPAPAAAGSSKKSASKKADSRKKSDKKRGDKKRPERASAKKSSPKKPDRRSRTAEVAASSKKSKAEGQQTVRTAGRVEPTVVSYSGSESDMETDADQPAGPRPANRLVASIPTPRVMEIQTALQKAGAYSGPIHGVWDQATFEAMTSFQRRHSFGATGMPTAESLKALGVRKNSGIGIQSPAVVLERTAPASSATRQPAPHMEMNGQQP